MNRDFTLTGRELAQLSELSEMGISFGQTETERAVDRTTYRLGDRLPAEMRSALHIDPLERVLMYEAEGQEQQRQIAQEPEPLSDKALKIALLIALGIIFGGVVAIFIL